MKVKDFGNQSKPHVEYRVRQDPEFGEVHTWSTMLWAAKFKDGIYRPMDRYVVSATPIPEIENKIKEDCAKMVKAGRYHDWFFGKRQNAYN